MFRNIEGLWGLKYFFTFFNICDRFTYYFKMLYSYILTN